MSGKYFTQSGAIGLPDDLNQGIPGESSYIYIGYASDATGSDFSTTPASNLTYISFYTTDTPVTPVVGLFSNWVKYLGNDSVLTTPEVIDMTGQTSDDVTLTGVYTLAILTGTNTGGFSLGYDGTPSEGDVVDIISIGTVPTIQTLTLLGTSVHATFNTHKYRATAVYNNGGFVVVPTSLDDGVVGSQQLAGSIPNSKIQYPHIYLTKNSITTQVALNSTYDIGTFSLETEATGVLSPANGGTGLSAVISGLLKGNGSTYSTATPGTDYLTASSSNTLTNKVIDTGSNTISNLTVANFNAAVISADGTFGSPNNTTIPTTQAVKTLADRISTGVKYIQDVKLASTGNIAAITGAMNIDNVAVTNGDRILLRAQTDASENGVYIANTSGAWSRATDQDTATEIGQSWVHVTHGDTLIGNTYVCKNFGSFTLETDDITYEEAPQLTYDAGTGLTQTGATFSIDTTTTVDKTTAQSLSNKILVSPDINGGTVDNITSLTVANNVDIGSYEIRALVFQSDIAAGSPPFVVASNTLVTNLNADKLDGKDAPTGAIVGTVDDQALSVKTIILKAGSTSVAPLKFLTGSLLSTPEAGTIEFDGTNFYITI